MQFGPTFTQIVMMEKITSVAVASKWEKGLFVAAVIMASIFILTYIFEVLIVNSGAIDFLG